MSDTRFEIRKSIWLAFFNGRDQYDREIRPGEGYLTFNNCDILWHCEDVTRISDTANWLLTSWLADGSIEKVESATTNEVALVRPETARPQH